MSLLRRRPEEPPPRRPHPDARTEAELQRIISLRRAVTRKEAQLDANDGNLKSIRNTMRANSGSAYNTSRAREADALQRESAQLGAEVIKLHDEIAERVGRIDDADLAWLDSR